MARTDPATRRRGAHFLVADHPVVQRVVDAAHLKAGETALDVGAGDGVLTQRVAAAVAPGGRVVAVENDAACIAALRETAWPSVDVVAGDILHVTLRHPIDAVVANPPYRLLPAILRRLLDHGFGRAVLVMPRELADRLTAEPGTESYGKLTVEIGVRAKSEVLFPVPRRAFTPRPDVDSAAVRITPRTWPATDPTVLDALLEAAWAARRKPLRHAAGPIALALGVSAGAVSSVVLDCQVAERRFADVSPWEFGDVARRLAAARTGAA